ncbi:MAG: dihydrofolate reductase [Syntrophothermus sp.]
MLSIIVAIAEGNAIGKNNDLLAYIPQDLKRFKQITTGHTIIMGKKTLESLPKHPLPNRRNIVISDDPADQYNGCEMARSIEDAIAKCNPEEENFIIGGASVYRQFIPFTDKLYLTLIHKKFDADVFFPEISDAEWELVSREDVPLDETIGFAYSYVTFLRRKK